MLAVRWRVGAMFAVLAAAAVCFSLQPAGIVTAEDKNPQSSVKEESTADQETGADEKPASGKTKKSDAKKKKDSKQTPKKKGPPNSSRQSATGRQGTAQSAGGSAGGRGSIRFGGAGGGAGSNGGAPANGGGGGGNAGDGPGGNPGQQGALPGNAGPDPKEVQRVMLVQEKHTRDLMQQAGIAGTATGLNAAGKVVVKVFTTGEGKPAVPKTLGDVAVEVEQYGPFFRYSGFAGDPKYDPKKRAPRPVPIGTSGINLSFSCGNQCSTGTIGCRLRAKDGSGFYALSNNHVFADLNAAALNTPIVQPGPADADCLCITEDEVGRLVRFKPLDSTGAENRIDAAIISTTEGLIGNSTLPDGYGAPRSYVVKEPFIGQKVMKYGRTTGFTKGRIIAVNASVNVQGYFFTGQTIIIGEGGTFGGPGDSGSLIVDGDRFPVGLLFAGGGQITIANRIHEVLDFFNMEIDGDSSEDFVPPGKIGHTRPK